jgi:hypothetical protein
VSEQWSDDRALEQRSKNRALTEQADAGEHRVGRRVATRLAARHWEQLDAAGPMASARASGWRRTPTEAPYPGWSLLHPSPLPPPSPKETLGGRAQKPRCGIH